MVDFKILKYETSLKETYHELKGINILCYIF